MPFDIPDSWEWVRLVSVGEVVGGGTPKTEVKSYWNGGTIPWLTPADMKWVVGKYVSKGNRSITPTALNSCSAQLMPAGSIIYSSRAPIGYIAIAQNELCTNQGFKSIVPVLMELSNYLYHVLTSFTPEIQSRASGTTFKEISGKEFSLTLVPLPPLQEQHRIVQKIEDILPHVEEYGKHEDELSKLNKNFPDALRKSLLQWAIQGKLVPQDENDEPASALLERIAKERAAKLGKKAAKSMSRIERRGRETYYEVFPDGSEENISDKIPFEIPESWAWCRLDQVGETSVGLTYKPSDIRESGIAVLRANNIQEGRIKYADLVYVETEIPDRAFVHKGDLLICARNGSKKLVGKTALVEREGDAFGAFMAKFTSSFSPFLYVFFSSPFFREQLDDANTTTIYQVTQAMLKNLICPLPPMAEQIRICNKLEELLHIMRS